MRGPDRPSLWKKTFLTASSHPASPGFDLPVGPAPGPRDLPASGAPLPGVRAAPGRCSPAAEPSLGPKATPWPPPKPSPGGGGAGAAVLKAKGCDARIKADHGGQCSSEQSLKACTWLKVDRHVRGKHFSSEQTRPPGWRQTIFELREDSKCLYMAKLFLG